MTIQQLHDKRNATIAFLRAIVDKADKENRHLTSEERANIEKAKVDVADILDEIRKLDDVARIEAEAAAIQGNFRPDNLSAGSDERAQPGHYEKAVKPALLSWLRGGHSAMSADEVRALQADLDTGGGYLNTPKPFMAGIIQAMDNLLFIRKLGQVFTMDSTEGFAPTLDNDPSDPEWTAEISESDISADSTMSIGRRKMTPHQLMKLVTVSLKQLIINPSFDAFVQARIGYKMSRAQEYHFLRGNGSNQPLGVFTASDSGIPTTRDVSTKNATTSISADNCKRVKHALKQGYWARAAWIGGRDWYTQVCELKGGDGHYLLREALSAADPDRLLGCPVYLSEDAPSTFTTGQYVAVLGDWSYYGVAQLGTMRIQRLVEKFALQGKVGLLSTGHFDGMPLLAEAFSRQKLA